MKLRRLLSILPFLLVGCGSSTDIDVTMEARSIDRPTAERALDEFRNACRPLFNRHADAVSSIRATVSDEASTQMRRLGWGGHLEIVVALKRSTPTLPQPAAETARFLVGGGEHPGVMALSPTAAALCDQMLAPGRTQAFLPAPGLADYLPKLTLNPTNEQIRAYRAETARAMAGDYQSQRNIAWCFVDGCYGVEPIDDLRACAWRLVIANAKHPKADASDRDNVETDCRQALAPADLTLAIEKAQELFRKIYKRELPQLQ